MAQRTALIFLRAPKLLQLCSAQSLWPQVSWQGAWHSGRRAHTQAQPHPDRPQSSSSQDDYQDPFQAAMRGKTEKELMELILQRGQRELADEEAAEVSFAGDICVLGYADACVSGLLSCLSLWLCSEPSCA